MLPTRNLLRKALHEITVNEASSILHLYHSILYGALHLLTSIGISWYVLCCIFNVQLNFFTKQVPQARAYALVNRGAYGQYILVGEVKNCEVMLPIFIEFMVFCMM